MKIKTLRWRLTPLHKFYFGGERTLGADNNDYFVVSNRFPQQTTLLGALRYKILEWQGGLTDRNGKQPDDFDYKKWIGEASFGSGKKSEPGSFGIIQSLSPCLLFDGEDYWAVSPKASNGRKGYTWQPSAGSWSFTENQEASGIPHLSGYDYKKWVPLSAINLTTGKTLPLDDIFKPVTQVGITKPSKEHPDQEKAFYKQTAWRFAKSNWSFVCWVRIEESDEPEQSFSAYLKTAPFANSGGERSLFSVKLENADLPVLSKLASLADPAAPQVILLSDAWATNGLYEHSLFAMSEAVDFRYIQSTPGKTKFFADLYQKQEKGTEKLNKTDRYSLLERGTTLYCEDEQDLLDELELPQAFRQIGYNAYAVFRGGQLDPEKTQFLWKPQP